MNNPNLSNEINDRITKSEIDGGVWVKEHDESVTQEIKKQPVLDVGKKLLIQTQNTLYTLEKRGIDDFWLSGNTRFCPKPTKVNIHGSTWGSSMIKLGWVGRGMHLEFSISGEFGTILTSEIKDIKEV